MLALPWEECIAPPVLLARVVHSHSQASEDRLHGQTPLSSKPFSVYPRKSGRSSGGAPFERWGTVHEDHAETMRLGMLLSPCYPAVEYAPGHTLCEGREAWLWFHLQPGSSVEMVRRRVMAFVEEQWRESA